MTELKQFFLILRIRELIIMSAADLVDINLQEAVSAYDHKSVRTVCRSLIRAFQSLVSNRVLKLSRCLSSKKAACTLDDNTGA